MVSIVDNFTDAEAKRLQLIYEIQDMAKVCKNKSEIRRKFQLSKATVNKYIQGNPEILCRSNKRSSLDQYKDTIINSLSNGMTTAETIRQILNMGAHCSQSNIRQYITSVIEQYQLEVQRLSPVKSYHSK